MQNQKKIIFVTGTRADFGKLKSLMKIIQDDINFQLHVFVTGMHMLAKYGYTCEEVEKANFQNIHKFINQNVSDGMDHVLAKSILGLSDYVRENLSTVNESQSLLKESSTLFKEYGVGAQILRDLGVREMILLSNTKRSIVGLEGHDLKIVEQRPIGYSRIRPVKAGSSYA